MVIGTMLRGKSVLLVKNIQKISRFYNIHILWPTFSFTDRSTLKVAVECFWKMVGSCIQILRNFHKINTCINFVCHLKYMGVRILLWMHTVYMYICLHFIYFAVLTLDLLTVIIYMIDSRAPNPNDNIALSVYWGYTANNHIQITSKWNI